MAGIKAVLMDLDGTVYRGNELIDGAASAIEYIRDSSLELVFFTNGSGKTRSEIASKLNGMGIWCSEDDVLSSGYMAAVYASEKRLKDVYVCGTDSLRSEFRSRGIELVDPMDAKNTVIGFDPQFDFDKLKDGVEAALGSDTVIACNKERIYPCSNGRMCPGCGAMVSSIEYCIGRESDIVIGKPNTLMLDHFSKASSIRNSEILVVGDTYESDIAMAERYGSQAILIGGKHEGCVSVNDISQLSSIVRESIERDGRHLNVLS